MRILVEVNCEEGEEYLRLTEITEEALNRIIPIINYVFNELNGYYPTGDYYTRNSKVEILQQQTYIEEFEYILPLPKHGFDRIINIEVL